VITKNLKVTQYSNRTEPCERKLQQHVFVLSSEFIRYNLPE